MSRRDQRRPTDGELEILRVLWEQGPCTVRAVHETVSRAREVGNTTILKLMQIMTEKGTLERDESVRPQVYHTVRSEGQTQRQFVGDLLDRVFGGSPGNLVMQALSSTATTAEERRRIRELLDTLEEDSR